MANLLDIKIICVFFSFLTPPPPPPPPSLKHSTIIVLHYILFETLLHCNLCKSSLTTQTQGFHRSTSISQRRPTLAILNDYEEKQEKVVHASRVNKENVLNKRFSGGKRKGEMSEGKGDTKYSRRSLESLESIENTSVMGGEREGRRSEGNSSVFEEYEGSVYEGYEERSSLCEKNISVSSGRSASPNRKGAFVTWAQNVTDVAEESEKEDFTNKVHIFNIYFK